MDNIDEIMLHFECLDLVVNGNKRIGMLFSDRPKLQKAIEDELDDRLATTLSIAGVDSEAIDRINEIIHDVLSSARVDGDSITFEYSDVV